MGWKKRWPGSKAPCRFDRSFSDAVLPADGVRIDPSYAPYLPKLRISFVNPAIRIYERIK